MSKFDNPDYINYEKLIACRWLIIDALKNNREKYGVEGAYTKLTLSLENCISAVHNKYCPPGKPRMYGIPLEDVRQPYHIKGQ